MTVKGKYGGRKIREGTVVSDKMQKTVLVAIEQSVTHRLYKKRVRRIRRFMAHDETEDCKLGDRVRIVEASPISRRKRWRVVEVLQRVELPEVAAESIDLELLGEVKRDEEAAPPEAAGVPAPEEIAPAPAEEAAAAEAASIETEAAEPEEVAIEEAESAAVEPESEETVLQSSSSIEATEPADGSLPDEGSPKGQAIVESSAAEEATEPVLPADDEVIAITGEDAESSEISGDKPAEDEG